MGPWTPTLLSEGASRKTLWGVGAHFSFGEDDRLPGPDDFSLVPPGGTVSFFKKEMVGPKALPLGEERSAAFGRRKRFVPACGAECSALPCAVLSGAASPPKREWEAGGSSPWEGKKRGLWPQKKVRPRLRRGMLSAWKRCFKRRGFAAEKRMGGWGLFPLGRKKARPLAAEKGSSPPAARNAQRLEALF